MGQWQPHRLLLTQARSIKGALWPEGPPEVAARWVAHWWHTALRHFGKVGKGPRATAIWPPLLMAVAPTHTRASLPRGVAAAAQHRSNTLS